VEPADHVDATIVAHHSRPARMVGVILTTLSILPAALVVILMLDWRPRALAGYVPLGAGLAAAALWWRPSRRPRSPLAFEVGVYGGCAFATLGERKSLWIPDLGVLTLCLVVSVFFFSLGRLVLAGSASAENDARDVSIRRCARFASIGFVLYGIIGALLLSSPDSALLAGVTLTIMVLYVAALVTLRARKLAPTFHLMFWAGVLGLPLGAFSVVAALSLRKVHATRS